VEAGERAEAVAFCERLRPRLVGALSLYCGDAALAEEHAQEALIRVWETWPRATQMRVPEAWAVRIGMNCLRSTFRHRAVERRALARAAALRTDTEVEPAEDENAHVRGLVAALPHRQRTALVLRYYLDLSVADTAAAMGCAEGTVKSLTSKALGQLGQVLSPDRETDTGIREVRR
jgi:RNA polymerase sigma factor (sigma-70 family)